MERGVLKKPFSPADQSTFRSDTQFTPLLHSEVVLSTIIVLFLKE